MDEPDRWMVADPRDLDAPEGAWLYLDGGTLDVGVWRFVVGWSSLRYAVLRPWRWHTIPRLVRRWGKPLNDTNEFRMFTETFLQPPKIVPRTEFWTDPIDQ